MTSQLVASVLVLLCTGAHFKPSFTLPQNYVVDQFSQFQSGVSNPWVIGGFPEYTPSNAGQHPRQSVTSYAAAPLPAAPQLQATAVDQSGRVDYTGWKVLDVTGFARMRNAITGINAPRNNLEHPLLDLEENPHVRVMQKRQFDDLVQIAVSPQAFQQITADLQRRGFSVIDNGVDLGHLVNSAVALPRATLLKGKATYSQYMNLTQINDFLDEFAKKNSDVVKSRVFGHTSDGRPIRVFILTSNSDRDSNDDRSGQETVKRDSGYKKKCSCGENKPVIFIDGAIHAREWISPATLVYTLEQLVQNEDLLEGAEWWVIPVLNPDGYEYAWTTDRMWRKNRSWGSNRCRGIDLNRNFDHHFGGPGTSDHPCSEVFKGSEAFSEAESKAVKEVVDELGDRLKGYVTVHSYGQVIMHPWGHTKDEHPRTAELKSVGDAMAAAARAVAGYNYIVGSTSTAMYLTSGTSRDWVASKGVPYTYTIELRDRGRHGFLLPASQILDTAMEGWEAIKCLGEKIIEEFSSDKSESPEHDRSAQPTSNVPRPSLVQPVFRFHSEAPGQAYNPVFPAPQSSIITPEQVYLAPGGNEGSHNPGIASKTEDGGVSSQSLIPVVLYLRPEQIQSMPQFSVRSFPKAPVVADHNNYE